MNLDIDIIGRFAKFQDALDQISKSTSKMQKDVSASTQLLRSSFEALTAGLTVGAFTLAIKNAIDLGDQFNDLGVRTGLTAQQLLVLKGAADRSGSSLEGLDTLASKIPKVLKEAGDSGSYAARAINSLGVDPKQGLTDLYGYLQNVGKGLAQFQDGAGKSALAIAALGKGGDKLIGLVQSIAETEERLRRLGITMSEEFKAKADGFNDKLVDLSELSKQSAREIATGLLPALNSVVDAFIEVKREGGGFVAVGEYLGKTLRELSTFAATSAYEFEAIGHAFRNLKEIAASPFSSESFSAMSKRMQAEADAITAKYRKTLETINGVSQAPDEAKKPLRTAPTPASDKDFADAKATADAKRRLDESLTKIQLDSEKALASARQSILDAYYSQGLIHDRDYWAARQTIIEEALTAERQALDTQIARQKAALNDPGLSGKDRVDREKSLIETLAKRSALELDAANKSILLDTEREKAADAYADAIRNINNEIANLSGNSVEAAVSRFEQQTRVLRQKAEAGGDAGNLAAIGRLRDLTAAQAAYNDQQQKAALIEQALATQEARVRTSQEVGALSEIEALRLTGEARARALPQLQQIADKMREIAQSSGNSKLIADADTFIAKIDQLAQLTDLLGVKISGIFTDQFAQAFTDFATGAKSASDAFKSFSNTVLAELIRMQAQTVARTIFGNGGRGLIDLFSGFRLGGTKGGAVTGDTGSDWASGLASAVGPEKSVGAPNVTIVNHYDVDAASDRAVVANMIERGGEQNKKEILESMRRGGAFAR